MWNDKLDLTKLPKHKKCSYCGQELTLLPVNENIVFWIHEGEALEKCTTIVFKTSFIKYFYNMMVQKQLKLEGQMPKCPPPT